MWLQHSSLSCSSSGHDYLVSLVAMGKHVTCFSCMKFFHSSAGSMRDRLPDSLAHQLKTCALGLKLSSEIWARHSHSANEVMGVKPVEAFKAMTGEKIKEDWGGSAVYYLHDIVGNLWRSPWFSSSERPEFEFKPNFIHWWFWHCFN